MLLIMRSGLMNQAAACSAAVRSAASRNQKKSGLLDLIGAGGSSMQSGRLSVMPDPAFRQYSDLLTVETCGQGLRDITREVERWLGTTDTAEGLLTLFCRHTSASLLIQENAAPAVQRDISAYFSEIAPEDPLRYEHDDEGPDDMPAHLRTALTAVSLQIPVLDGRLRLGTWQGIYLFEHRRRPHRRDIATHVMGTSR